MKNHKKDFPIFQNNPDLIYLDSAATSQKPRVVLDAINEYYTSYNANIKRGIYPIAEKATAKVEEVRKKVAQFINAKSKDEIIFVRNATEAINLVAYSLASTSASWRISRGDTIATTIMEHHSNFVPWQQLAIQKNADFLVLDIDQNFKFQISNFKYQIKNAKILAITHVSNVLGTINPLKKMINDLRTVNADLIILVDAAQSVPHMSVDVQDLDCDFLVFSGHKMMAATGIGVLYGKKTLLSKMQPFLYGGEMIREVTIQNTSFAKLPHKFEAGTPDIAGIVSLGAAIEYLNSTGIENVLKHEIMLIKYALEQLKNMQELTIYGSTNARKRGGVISFNLKGIHPHDVAQILGEMEICIRAGHHCAMPLHNRLGIPASARISFYIYNEEQDIDKFVNGLQKVQKMFR
ncbi:MAG: cysteine desulfurase [Candidatus Levybacteria bacterium]|nr:cysteine desulfurase [Candidatus Levybacteria bacterium]